MSFNYDSLIDHYMPILYTGVILTIISIVWFEFQKRNRWSIFLLVAGAICIRLFVSLIDPFLHIWDEQFHALVAKNMMTNPLVPVLIPNPVLPYHFQNWTANYVWLHKQPLFLWQMALSMKLFGVNELAARIPSIIMSSFSILMIYRIGSIIYNRHGGFIGAVLYAGSTYLIELTSGRIPTDHNDVAFLFYVSASLWSWFEYEHSQKKYWIWFIGIFSGFAILVKWLPGLLVYAGWVSTILLKERRRNVHIKDPLKSLLLTVLIVFPWQIYAAIRFPKEYFYELSFNSHHFYKVIEGHSGTIFFHLNQIPTIYGTDYWYIIAGNLLLFFFIKTKTAYKTFVFTVIVFTYIFYSLAATKLVAYTIVVAPLIYAINGIALAWLLDKISFKKLAAKRRDLLKSLISMLVISFLFVHFLNHNRLTLENLDYRKQDNLRDIHNTLVYRQLNDMLPGRNVYFNTYMWDHIKIMYYTDDIAYKKIPDQNTIQELKNKNFRVVVFDNGELPGYILSDKSIAKLKTSIWDQKNSANPEVYY